VTAIGEPPKELGTKNYSGATSFTRNPTRTGLGSNPGLRSHRSATNHVSHRRSDCVSEQNKGRFTLCVTFAFCHCSVTMLCVHTVRRVQSPSRAPRDRRPAIISIKHEAPFVF
jgi:hypothetical protein